MKDDNHAVAEIRIDDADTVVVCSCGWKSKKCKDETTARKQYDAHLEDET